MSNNGFAEYREYLRSRLGSELSDDKTDVQNAFLEDIIYNPAYQPNAKRNGETQPIAIKRKDTETCEFTVMPGDEMYIGDLIDVLDEKWLVVELHVDEYGMLYGECRMCNLILHFQNGTPHIITKYAILDNGSYTDTTGKPVSTTDANFICYVSKDEETSKLYVDKRLAIDNILDRDGKEILTVGRITWIDGKSENYGKGAHLLKFRLDNDIFNPDEDSIEHMICNYIVGDTSSNEEDTGAEIVKYIEISGVDQIRLGTTRTYTASSLVAGQVVNDTIYQWTSSIDELELIVSEDTHSCKVKIPLDSTYVGVNFILTCKDASDSNIIGYKEVVIITNG